MNKNEKIATQIRDRYPKYWHGAFSFLTYFVIMLIVFTILFFYTSPSIWMISLMVSLMLTLLIHYVTVPMAIIQKFRENKTISFPLEEFPRITIIVPAYNEEKVLRRTIENLIEAYYPNKEIIVVDDGSIDGTFEIAKKFESQGIKIVKRMNGGKYAALNTGLTFATGEIIITVDADSLITRTSLVEIVKEFENQRVGVVAGALKVFNKNKFLAKLQAMEYLIQTEIVRRAFDNFGTITFAPRAFSAFRRDVLTQSGNYDPDQLLEDFDLTIKIQKAHKAIRNSLKALCYTEIPETLRNIYKQRLNWYRGNFQNFWKHRDVLTNSKFGYIRSLTFPYMLLSMILIPFASIMVIATSIALIISGEWMILMYSFIIFIALQFLLHLLAVSFGKDDYKLLIISPFYAIGYKYFLDFIAVKALFDIILNRGHYLKRERVSRIGFQEKTSGHFKDREKFINRNMVPTMIIKS